MSKSAIPRTVAPPGSSVYGILQVKILEWVAIPFSRASSPPRDQTWVSYIAGSPELHTDSLLTEPPEKPLIYARYTAIKILQAGILEWVAIFFSRRSSRPRDWTCVSCISCIGRRILDHCATWEANSNGGSAPSLQPTVPGRSICEVNSDIGRALIVPRAGGNAAWVPCGAVWPAGLLSTPRGVQLRKVNEM